MDRAYELKYHLSEEKNWWFVARRNAILSLVKNYDKNIRILDIGCAGGPLIKDLTEQGFINVYGIDFSEAAIALCKERDLENIFVMDAHAPTFEDESFDLIIASDCLEHLKDDEIALKQWYRILKKGGEAVIFVPAFNFLWSSHDEVNQHYRRYTQKMLVQKMMKASFTLVRSSFWNFMLFFPTALVRLLQKNLRSEKKEAVTGQIVDLNPILNKLLIWLLKIENFIFVKFSLPIGVSVFAIGKK